MECWIEMWLSDSGIVIQLLIELAGRRQIDTTRTSTYNDSEIASCIKAPLEP